MEVPAFELILSRSCEAKPFHTLSVSEAQPGQPCRCGLYRATRQDDTDEPDSLIEKGRSQSQGPWVPCQRVSTCRQKPVKARCQSSSISMAVAGSLPRRPSPVPDLCRLGRQPDAGGLFPRNASGLGNPPGACQGGCRGPKSLRPRGRFRFFPSV